MAPVIRDCFFNKPTQYVYIHDILVNFEHNVSNQINAYWRKAETNKICLISTIVSIDNDNNIRPKLEITKCLRFFSFNRHRLVCLLNESLSILGYCHFDVTDILFCFMIWIFLNIVTNWLVANKLLFSIWIVCFARKKVFIT